MQGLCEKCGNLDQDESYCTVDGCPHKTTEQPSPDDVPVPDVPDDV